MLGPFATASRRTPHYHSPGVATVASHAACASMSTTTTTTTTTRDRGDRYGPMEWAQRKATAAQHIALLSGLNSRSGPHKYALAFYSARLSSSGDDEEANDVMAAENRVGWTAVIYVPWTCDVCLPNGTHRAVGTLVNDTLSLELSHTFTARLKT